MQPLAFSACPSLSLAAGTSMSFVLPGLRAFHRHLRDHSRKKAHRHFYMHALIAAYVARVVDDFAARSRLDSH